MVLSSNWFFFSLFGLGLGLAAAETVGRTGLHCCLFWEQEPHHSTLHPRAQTLVLMSPKWIFNRKC